MKTYEKIAITVIAASIWGAFEIFGAMGLRRLGLPHISPFLFAFALMAMLAAKRLGSFPGSAVMMGVIAAVYKTLSLDLHACGAVSVVAVIFDAAVFEATYAAFGKAIETSPLKRTILAPIIAICAYIPFGFYSAYIGGEKLYGIAGLNGIWAYLKQSGLWAAVLAVFAIHIGYYLGEALSRQRGVHARPSFGFPQALGIVVVATAWIARIAF